MGWNPLVIEVSWIITRSVSLYLKELEFKDNNRDRDFYKGLPKIPKVDQNEELPKKV